MRVNYIRLMLIKRAINIFLILLILLADSGQTIYAHTCFKTKHTHYSIDKPKHCCNEQTGTSHCIRKNSTCCEVNFKYLKQNFISAQKTTSQIAPVSVFAVFQNIFLRATQNAIELSPCKSPLLLACNKSCSIFTQTFRI